MAQLTVAYDRVLTDALRDLGFERRVAGLYVAPVDGRIWRGLQVSFVARHGKVYVAPSLCLYCPEAYRFMRSIFRGMGHPGFETGALSQKIGPPFVWRQLDVLMNQFGVPVPHRFTLSYDFANEIETSSQLLIHDFLLVHEAFFDRIRTLEALLDAVSAGRGALEAINAMALSVTIDPQVPLAQLQALSALSPSPITERFYQAIASMREGAEGVTGRRV